MWLVFSTTPYYTLNDFHLLFDLGVFSNKYNYEQVGEIQVISSIFFNSNHCFNFFIYFLFDFDFRKCFYNLFRNFYALSRYKKKFKVESIPLKSLNRNYS